MSVSCDVKSDMECLTISTKACVHSVKKHIELRKCDVKTTHMLSMSLTKFTFIMLDMDDVNSIETICLQLFRRSIQI